MRGHGSARLNSRPGRPSKQALPTRISPVMSKLGCFAAVTSILAAKLAPMYELEDDALAQFQKLGK